MFLARSGQQNGNNKLIEQEEDDDFEDVGQATI